MDRRVHLEWFGPSFEGQNHENAYVIWLRPPLFGFRGRFPIQERLLVNRNFPSNFFSSSIWWSPKWSLGGHDSECQRDHPSLTLWLTLLSSDGHWEEGKSSQRTIRLPSSHSWDGIKAFHEYRQISILIPCCASKVLQGCTPEESQGHKQLVSLPCDGRWSSKLNRHLGTLPASCVSSNDVTDLDFH